MIDVINQTPKAYSEQSRDYQVLARLYTALFNLSKMYIDNMQIWNTDIDNKLTILRAKTLNFDAVHAWDLNDLEAVTTCFKYLMRNKGTIKALEYCVNILMKVQNMEGEDIDEVVSINNYNVTIRVPENLFTLGILEDLVKYLLPGGLTFDIVRYKSYSLRDVVKTDIYYQDKSIEHSDIDYTSKMYVNEDKYEITDTFVYTGNEEFEN